MLQGPHHRHEWQNRTNVVGHARLNIIAITPRITLQGRTWKKRVRDDNASPWIGVLTFACVCYLTPDIVGFIENPNCRFIL